jgi:pantoate--beta-alanine ligase
VVSIFVNPTQFGPAEDLDQYPRTFETDAALCQEWGADAIFAPGTGEIYPMEQRTWVTVEGLTAPLCGRSRPRHFRGVTTVVSKLFHIVEPDVAVFGQKDAQQALVIRKMVEQLDMPVEITVAGIARENDGLALSSRNRYLDEDGRRRAAAINAALRSGLTLIEVGERDPHSVCLAVERDLRVSGVDEVEYVELLDATDLSTLAAVDRKVILAVAARIGGTRLIDNIVVEIAEDGSVREALLF